MDFTREPIIETVITARDGHRIVLRSSKNPGQEEFFVDAIEVVAFHSTCFYRCLERPRAFIVPASDYEVLEVREPRLPLKTPSIEGMVKIGGSSAGSSSGRGGEQSSSMKQMMPSKALEKEPVEMRRETRDYPKETQPSREQGQRDSHHDRSLQRQASEDGKRASDAAAFSSNAPQPSREVFVSSEKKGVAPQPAGIQPNLSSGGEPHDEISSLEGSQEAAAGDTALRAGSDRRRDRRRNLRRRRGSGRGEMAHTGEDGSSAGIASEESAGMRNESGQIIEEGVDDPSLPHPEENVPKRDRSRKFEAVSEDEKVTSGGATSQTSPMITSILPPPTTLIRDELARMRNNELYKGAFYIREEDRTSSSGEVSETSSSSQAHNVSEEKQSGQTKQNIEEDDDFILSSSLRFEDDEDDVQSNAYIARPIAHKKVVPSEEKESTPAVQQPENPLSS